MRQTEVCMVYDDNSRVTELNTDIFMFGLTIIGRSKVYTVQQLLIVGCLISTGKYFMHVQSGGCRETEY